MMYETGRRERIAAARGEAAGQGRREQQQRLARKILGLSATVTALQVLWAQFVCWGLSAFSVQSGIWGPFMLLAAAGDMIAFAVCLGMVMTAKRMNE